MSASVEQACESAAPGGAILSVAGLRREFGGVWACTDATFDLRRWGRSGS